MSSSYGQCYRFLLDSYCVHGVCVCVCVCVYTCVPSSLMMCHLCYLGTLFTVACVVLGYIGELIFICY